MKSFLSCFVELVKLFEPVLSDLSKAGHGSLRQRHTSHDGVHLRPSHFGILTDRRQLADHHPPTNNHTKVKPRFDRSLKSVVASLQHVYRSSDNRASRIPVHSAEQPRCKYALITLGHMWPTNTTTTIGVFDSTNCESRLLAFS